MNRSAPLSADARRLLELGSHVEPPTAEQNERMDRALAALFRTPRPGPATGSPLGAAEQPSAGPLHEAAGGMGKPAGNGELSGIRLRAAPRARSRFFEPLHGLGDGKLWLTLGALAATASASFWLGRLSTPAEEGGAIEAQTSASVALLASSESDRTESMAAIGASALGLLEAVAPSARPTSTSPTSASPTFAPRPLAAAGQLAAVPAAVSDESAAPPGGGVHTPQHASPARAKPGLRRDGARSLRSAGLAAEIEQLARAEAALRQGRAEHALVVLEQRSVQHLLEQAAALRAIAQCELGVASAPGSARHVLERWPASAFQPRIMRACGP
jgi:hypothetical protein